MKMNSKILAVAVVAMFVATAFAVVATEDNDAASGEQKTYHLYIEIIDEDMKVTAKQWSTFTCEKNNAAWAAKATVELQKVVEGQVNSVKDYYVNPSTMWIVYPEDSKWWASTFYGEKGKWALIDDVSTQYVENDTTAITLCPTTIYSDCYYISELPVGADASKYLHIQLFGGDQYFLLPQTSVTGYDSGMLLYIIIAVVIIVIIVAAVFYMKKKNA